MNTQEFLMKKIKEREGNYFEVIQSLIKNGVKEEQAIEVYHTYKKHKNLLNQENIYFFQYLNSKDENIKSQFESLSDDIHKSLVKSKHKRIKKILHSNHNDIVNNETEEIIQLFAESNISTKIIKQFVGKKIRAYKSSEELNNELNKLYEEINGSWNKDSYISKINESNSKIVFQEDNKLAVEILNFNDSQLLGTKNWCVSREELFYNDYTENNERFVFIFDFNEAPFSENSMKAAIVEVDGNIHEVYNKADVKIDNKSVINEKEAFNPINKETLIYKINNDKKINDSKNLVAMQYTIYGLYEEAKEILGEDKYKKDLSYLFSNKLTQIINGKNTVAFLNEVNEIITEEDSINSYDVFDWIREVSYLDKDIIENFFKLPIIQKLVDKELVHMDQEIRDYELTESVSHFFSENSQTNFEQGINFINKLSDLGIENVEELINLKNISYEALEFINEKNMISNKFDLSILRSNQNEDFFQKYFEIINLKEQDEKVINEISSNLFLNIIQNNGVNINSIYYGLKSYFKEDFESIQKDYFSIDNEKINLFNIVLSANKIKDTFTKVDSLFQIDKLTPDNTRDLLIKSFYSMNCSEYNELSLEKKKEHLESKYKNMPPPLKKDYLKFINNENFDLSNSKEFINNLSKIEGFESLKEKNSRKLKI